MEFASDELPAARLAIYWHPDDWVTLEDARLETRRALFDLAERLNVRPPSVLTANADPAKPGQFCETHQVYTNYLVKCPACG